MTSVATAMEPAHRRSGGLAVLAWPGAVSLVLLLGIVAGGSSQAQSAAFFAFRFAALALLGAGLLRLLRTRIDIVERLALALAVLAVCLVALQLVPLPYGLFSSLPGRGYVASVFSIAGIAPQSMPLTLSPAETTACVLALMPPIAIFIATLSINPQWRWVVVAALLAGVIANVILGLAQRFEGPQSGLYLYEIANFGSATGFFSNRNNFAMLLCVAVPLTWALTHRMMRRDGAPRLLILAAGSVMMAIIFLGLAVSNSRSGILLGMFALALSAAMAWAAPRVSRRSSGARLPLLAFVGAALIIGQFGMIGLLRIAETDPLTEYRNQITAVTLRTAAEYFPFGSGFGTFRDVYAMHETPATMVSSYINHAHNDWLELWLEGGLPAALLMACFLALFAWQAIRVWWPRGPYAPHLLPRAASIGVLVLMIHSLVEFPLRMPGLAAVFATLLALMMAPPPSHVPHGNRRLHHRDAAPAPAKASAAPAVPPVFKVAAVQEPSPKQGMLERDSRRR